MTAPVMHNVQARIHHFFVPNRLTWTGWEDFITGGHDGMDTSVVPSTPVADHNVGDVPDYFGIPPQRGVDWNQLPLWAYNLIFEEYYRDQDLVPSRTPGDISLASIAWEKDYFTTARPWTQKGPDVTIPLGERADISGLGWAGSPGSNGGPFAVTGGTHEEFDEYADSADNGNSIAFRGDGEGYPDIYADLSNATGADINDVRKAFAIQRYQEARARYGSRYTEYLRYLGVTPKDSRLQRPEFLGGGSTRLNFSEVLQTAPDNSDNVEFGVGDMYGHGIAAMRSNRYRRHIEEHGFVLTLMSVRPKTVYADGMPRQWLRQTKEDYFQKELSYIGQQAVYNNEVYADSADGMDTFGYQDRYAEYRTHPSQVTGEFRDQLDYWHMARHFDSPPALNETFVTCDPTKRIYNEQTQHPLWVKVNHKIAARRIVPRNANARVI